VLSWHQAVRGSQAPACWEEYRSRVERGLHCADVVTSPSRAMIACLEHHYGSLSNTLVIPNGRLSSQFRVGTQKPIILAAGRIWDEAKNIALLARIAGQLPWRVYVAGEQGRAALENVTCLGLLSQSNLASWMSRASIYCLPAKYEPFGLSILEAALSGCALVLGDIESLRENWTGCAQFIDPDDPNALYEVMMELIGNEPARRKLGRTARLRARQFSPQCMVEGYLQAYELALAKSQELTLTA
jgi:glycogen(starch) synthase